MEGDNDTPFYLAQNLGFGNATVADEFLHHQQNAEVAGDALAETQYLGFNLPEHGIFGVGYLWHHPNLKVMTGGLWVWQGRKPAAVASELFDIRAYLSDAALLKSDLHHYQLENSYDVKVLEPLKRLQMRYDDPQRGNKVDLEYTAITPVVMFGDNNHFEQGMRVRGELTLRGKRYDVDALTVRDRSWGKLRPELLLPLPPVSWMSCAFSEDLIFNCNMADHIGSNDMATGPFAVSQDEALKGGWICRKGRVSRIISARKLVDRERGTLSPRSITLEMNDEHGGQLLATGHLVASCPWAIWPNTTVYFAMLRWEAEGLIGHGDAQEAMWTDYIHTYAGEPLATA